jgi:hypothetical protein
LDNNDFTPLESKEQQVHGAVMSDKGSGQKDKLPIVASWTLVARKK